MKPYAGLNLAPVPVEFENLHPVQPYELQQRVLSSFYGPLSRTTRVSRYLKKHSPSHTYPNRQSSFISFLHLVRLQQPPCSIHVLDSLFAQPLSKSSLVYLLVWHPPLHTPHISSPNYCLLFAAHVHANTTWFAVVPRLCHLITLNTLLATLSCSFTPHIHLTVLISAR